MISITTIPYCYLVGWSLHSKYYYGVRYAKNCSPNDLWKTYFTSSKQVKKMQEMYGDPDIIQIRKTFNNIKKAQEWEKKVLSRMNVLHNTKWLNANIGGIIDIQVLKARLTGRKLSEETKEKMRLAKLGKSKTKKHVENMRGRIPWNKGKIGLQKHTEETKEKIRMINIGRSKSSETKLKISNTLRKKGGS